MTTTPTSTVRHACTYAFACLRYGTMGKERSCAVCFRVLSVAAAPEDPGRPGPGGADVELQLRDQRAAQDPAQDSQEQPCESWTMCTVLGVSFTEQRLYRHIRCMTCVEIQSLSCVIVWIVSITTVKRNSWNVLTCRQTLLSCMK